MNGRGRSLRWADVLCLALFLAVGTAVWLRSRPIAIGPFLARENARIERAAAFRAALPLFPPPSSNAEARAQAALLKRWIDAGGAGSWETLRALLARRGKPETQAAFAPLWREEQEASAAAEKQLTDWASATEEADPALAARRSEGYVAAVNRLQAAEEALGAWAERLAAEDFSGR